MPAIDETGKRHGRLLVISRGIPYGKRNRTTWECRCDCGKTATVLADLLRSGMTRSCGCLRGPINEVGNRYGKLVVEYEDGRADGVALWHCRCDCGQYTTTRAPSLRNGSTRSCGCINVARLRARQIPRRIRAMNIAFNTMKQNARGRDLQWQLPDDVVEHLCAQDCHYCGSPPSNFGRTDLQGVYRYNGLDRVDSARGYSVDNVVPCCIVCNRAKSDLPLAEFLEWVCRLSRKYSGHSRS